MSNVQLAALNKTAVDAYLRPDSGRPTELPHQSSEKRRRMLEAVKRQAEHLQDIPALVIACYEFDEPAARAGASRSIWPAVQNLLLAARARFLPNNVAAVQSG